MIQVNHMHLRMEGMDADQGHHLRKEVLRLLAEMNFSSLENRQIDQLSIRVALPPNTQEQDTAGHIARAIKQKINSGSDF